MTTAPGAGGLVADLSRPIAGHICLHAAMAGARLAAPLLALSHGYDAAATGMLVALFALTQIFLSLPAGRFADRHGLRRPVGWSVVAASLGIGLVAIWPTYPVLCVSAMLAGGAVGAATIALQRHVGRLAGTSTQRKQLFSWLAIAPAASNFVGPVLAGLVIDYAGFRAAFAVLAALPLICWFLMHGTRELGDESTHPSKSGAAWELLRDPGFRRLMLMNWFMAASWDLHGFMVPLLGYERGLKASVIGGILGAFSIAAVATRFVIPLLAAHLREWAVITGSMATTGLLLILYPLAQSALAMALLSAAIGLVLGTVQPMVMSVLHQITPSHRQGEAIAIRIIMVNVSSATIPVMLGAFGGLVGAAGVFWAMGTFVFAGSRMGLALRSLSDRDAGH